MKDRTPGRFGKRLKLPPRRTTAPKAGRLAGEQDLDLTSALWRVKSDRTTRVKSGDVLALQRSLGNKGIRQMLQRYGHVEGAAPIGRTSAVVQRHQIPEGRTGVGEEDDEIVVQRLVERQAAFGRPGPSSERRNPWGSAHRDVVRRQKGKGGAGKAGGGAPAADAPVAKGGEAGKGAKGLELDAEAKKAAEAEYKQFVSGGPYSIKDYVPDTIDDFGKFDAIYDPANKQLKADMRVKFVFPDIKVPKGDTVADKMQRLNILMVKQLYIGNFISQVHKGWSGKFQFRNVREPQEIWGALNPIRVKVNVSPVASNQHYTLEGHLKTAGTANVEPNVGDKANRVQLFAGDLDPKTQDFTNDPKVGKGELARLQRNLPKIRFANASTAIDAKYIPDLKFIGDYLRGMNVPKFNLMVVGRANKTGNEDANMKFSQARAQAVADKLKEFGVTNHVITVQGVGSAGATADGSWRKAEIVPTLDKGFKNVQDTTLHEFGHMLGLDDEYVRDDDKRKHTTQQKWMRKMLAEPGYGKGKENRYADEVTKVDPEFSASVMERGSEVRSYHYVTLWQALYDTAAKAPKQPTPALTWRDWKVSK